MNSALGSLNPIQTAEGANDEKIIGLDVDENALLLE